MNIAKLIAKFIKDGFKSLSNDEVSLLKENTGLMSKTVKVKFEKEAEDQTEDDHDDKDVEEDEGEDDEDEDDEDLDEKALKKLIGKNVKSQISKFEQRMEKAVEKMVEKFVDGVKDNRSKILGNEANVKDSSNVRDWFKALINGDTARAKALTDSPSGSSPDDAKAGLLIPTELMAEVLRIAQTQYGLARRAMRYLPFSGPGNSRTIPALGTSVSVYWTNEGAKKNSTQPKFNVVSQTLKKLAAIVPFTDEILEDSAINLTQLLAELFAEAVSKEEDLQFFAGTGAPWTGIINNGDVVPVYQANVGGIANMDAKDFLSMQTKVPTAIRATAGYILHPTVFDALRGLKDDNGRFIVQDPSGNLPGTIWNKPYELSDAMPAFDDVDVGDPYVIFTDLKKTCIFGDKQQIRAKLLDQATITDTDGETVINLAEQDMQALRIVERVGYVIGLPAGIAVLFAENGESGS